MKKIFKCFVSCLCALCFCLACFNSTNAYADNYDHSSGGGDSGGYHGNGKGNVERESLNIHWASFNENDAAYMKNWGWKKEEHPNLIAAFLTEGRLSDEGVPLHTTWDYIFTNWGFGSYSENLTANYPIYDGRLLDRINDPGDLNSPAGPVHEFSHDCWNDFIWYRNIEKKGSGNRDYILDMVTAEGVDRPKEVPPTPEPDEDTRIVISYVHGGLGEQIDDRGQDAKWLWDKNRKGPIEYWDKTNPNETVANRRIDAEITTVYRYEVCDSYSCDDDGFCWCSSSHYEYDIIDRQPYTKDFTYNTITPTIKQEPFKPWNLNRNGYATTDDISSQYAHAKLPIELDVNNNQGIYDNSPLKALDINNDTFFKFKFTNGYLGMPSVFNWTNPPGTPPGILNNGTWEDAGSGGYANGRNAKADKDGLYRYNVKLHMSMSPNTKKPFVDTSSINFNGSEFTTSEEALQRPPWAGGELSTRFTYADTYWTDNNKEGSKFPAWWVNTYTMGRFYEYGSEWHGLVTLSGIEDPNNVMYGTGQSTGYDSYKITIDANKQQKGLYVGYASANFEQPIITGTWEVKTVAGYVN